MKRIHPSGGYILRCDICKQMFQKPFFKGSRIDSENGKTSIDDVLRSQVPIGLDETYQLGTHKHDDGNFYISQLIGFYGVDE